MLKEEISEVLHGIHPSWSAIMKIPDVKEALVKCLTMLSYKNKEVIVPKHTDIMRVFRMSMASIRVVIIGQDPYHGKGQANGQAFAINKGFSIPPSLNNIYKALLKAGWLKKMPGHGDLSAWINHGVMMLNSKLTTEIGSPNHPDHSCWEVFTDKIIHHLTNDLLERERKTVFMLWGTFAKNKRAIIESTCNDITGSKLSKYILTLARPHPSPLADNSLSPTERFIYCDHFTKAQGFLGQISWTIDDDDYLSDDHLSDSDGSDVSTDKLTNGAKLINVKRDPNEIEQVMNMGIRMSHGRYRALKSIQVGDLLFDSSSINVDMSKLRDRVTVIFTDGACSGNGKKNARAGAGMYVGTGALTGRSISIHVPLCTTIAGVIQPSNNRGELEGIRCAVKTVITFNLCSIPIMIVTDSKYCVGVLSEWYPGRIRNHTEDKLANLDMIASILNLIMDYKLKIMFKLVRASHDIPIDNRSDYTQFIYMGNDIADKLAVDAKVVPKGN
jgi:uracil-DNA glycosylase